MITKKLKINYSKTEFRFPHLKCGLSANVGESLITQSSKASDLGVIFDQFLNFDDHICRSTHFHIRNIGKIMNLLSYDACSTIIHALICCRLEYCNSIRYNVPMSKTDRLKDFRINARASRQNRRVWTILPQYWKKYFGSKFKIESYTKFWCLHINRIAILHRLIYVNWLTTKKVMWILAWELIIISLLCRKLVSIVLTLFIYAAPYEWNKLSEHITT